MAGRSLSRTLLPTVAAAVLGNAFVGRDSPTWFADLRRPRMQVPMPAFYAVGASCYGVDGAFVLAPSPPGSWATTPRGRTASGG